VLQVLTIPRAEAAQPPTEVVSIDDLITASARKYGVNRRVLYETLDCESIHFKDARIQSGYYKNGVRENSWGFAQFNLPSSLKTADGRTITKEIAIDPAQAIDAAAYNFSIGNAREWSCYRDKANT
jgi:hypothetical protein